MLLARVSVYVIGTRKCTSERKNMFDLNNLNDEFFDNVNKEEILDVKSLQFKDKVTCFSYFLTSDHITNVSVLANIFLVINGFSEFSSDVENDPKVFFNNIEEYVDIKLKLKKEIESFCIKLIENYLGVLLGLTILLDERKEHIKNTHFNILHLADIKLISKLMNKYLAKIDFKNIKPAHCSSEIYEKINGRTMLFQDLLTKVLGGNDTNDIIN